MTGTIRRLVLAFALLALADDAGAQRRRPAPPPAPAPPALPPDIRIRSALSQSAAWLGDPLDFVVEVETGPGVELVADDFAAEKLVIEGLELGAVTSTVESKADGWRLHRHTYHVVPWDTAAPKRIGALTVRVRRPVTTATADGTAPVTDVQIPGATLALRSTLPDDGSASGTRDRVAPAEPPGWLPWLRPAGFGFIALGIAPVVLWLATRIRRPRITRSRPSSRSLQARVKAMFDELQIIDTSSVDGRRRAYDRIETDLRGYLAQAEGVPATALTSAELRPRLAASRRVQGEAVCDVLAECEDARYGPEARLPDAERLGATIARLRTALGH
jgi:hypothetical protein